MCLYSAYQQSKYMLKEKSKYTLESYQSQHAMNMCSLSLKKLVEQVTFICILQFSFHFGHAT